MTRAPHVSRSTLAIVGACALVVGCDSNESTSVPSGPEKSTTRAVALAPTESPAPTIASSIPAPASASDTETPIASTAKTEAAVPQPTARTSRPLPPAPPSDPPRASALPASKKNVGEFQEATFDTIKLALEKDQPFDPALLTPEVKALDGQNIRIRGYIHPNVFRQTGITQFVLVRDNQQCCFGPGAALHDCIIVEMKPGKSTDFSVRPVTVEGKFTLVEWLDPDPEAARKHLAIYHLDGERVQ